MATHARSLTGTNTDHLMAVLNRWIAGSNLPAAAVRKVTTLIDNAIEDTRFRDDLDAVLNAADPPELTAGTLRNMVGDWCARTAGSDRDNAAGLFTDAVVAAARVENSSLGGRGAQLLRDRVRVRNAEGIREIRRQLSEPEKTFWSAISPGQREEFRMLAEDRTFAAGARLMQEGETADYVTVILDGRTRISVRGSNGIERVVAHRGPGQLVGERAAMRVNVRSATVTTLDQVQALAMTTANFATFLTAHPDVLQLVEEQIYERLTETPEEDLTVRALPVSAETTSLADYDEPVAFPATEVPVGPRPWDGQNCTTIFSDVVAFGSTARSEEHRRIIRREVFKMTHASLRAVWDQCHHEDRGDGMLVVVPPGIPPVQILEYLLIALPIALKRHNHLYAEGAQIQLRVALDVGLITADEFGVSGQVIINAARLLETPAFKAAVGAKRALLGMIVSDFVYQTAASQTNSLVDPASYEEIDVNVKQTQLRAWTLLVESPVGAFKAADDPQRRPLG